MRVRRSYFKDKSGLFLPYRERKNIFGYRAFGLGSYKRVIPNDGVSYAFDGTGDYLSVADSADWFFDLGDFALSFWVYFTTFGTPAFVSSGVGGPTSWRLRIIAGDLVFDQEGEAISISNAWAPSTGQWYWVAMSKDSSDNYRMFVDGSQIGSTSADSSQVKDHAGGLFLGSLPGGADFLDGFLDDIHIMKGTDNGWTGTTITVPTKQDIVNENSVLLIHCGEEKTGTTGSGATFTDTTGNHTVTEVGNAIEETTTVQF